MNRFEMVGEASHNHHGRHMVKGDTIDSESDLVSIFPTKFKLLGAVTRAELPALASVPSKTPASSSSAPPADNDVTAEFPGIEKQGLRVIQVSKDKFNVVDPARPDRPLNPKPVKRTKVADVLVA